MADIEYLNATVDPDQPFWLQLGSFVLTPSYSTAEGPTYPTRLQKCHSRTVHILPTPAVGGSTSLLASSRAVLCPQDGSTLHGVFLPSLRLFEIPHFKAHYPVVISGDVLYATANFSANASSSDLETTTIARP